MLGLVQQIQLAVVSLSVLYGEKLWWKDQKNYKDTFQQLFNRQTQSITRIYPSTLIYPFLYEVDLTSASIILDNYQKLYAYQLLSLLDKHTTKTFLHVSWRIRDGALDKQPKNNLI